MDLYKETIRIETQGDRTTYVDITKKVNEIIKESNIKEGLCVVMSPHTTCSVFFEEFSHDINDKGDEFLQTDLNNILGKIIPSHDCADTYHYPGEKHYQAVESWPNTEDYLPDGDRSALWNGDGHLKATLIGSSQTFDVTENKLGLGSTGYIYFADFDQTRSRTRKAQITIIGK